MRLHKSPKRTAVLSGPIVFMAISTMLMLLVNGCSCTDKKRKDSGGAVVAATTPTPGPTPLSEVEKDTGVEVPPFQSDKISTVDTTDAPGIFHFKFEAPTTSVKESARYKMEYLLVVRANEDSCFRLKVRPSSGVSQSITTKDFVDKGVDACAGIDEALKTASTAPTATPTPTPSPSATAAAKLGLTGSGSKDEQDRFKDLEWGVTSQETGGFELAASSRELCDRRLFRMKTANRGLGSSTGLEAITTKTGRLVYQTASKKVSVWVDDEYADMCQGVVPVNGKKVAFGPLIQRGSVPSTEKDQLTTTHLQIAGTELEKSLTALTTLYGGISDIDGSNGVDLFISPEINRLKLTNALTSQIDHFRANLTLKPEDLARYNTISNPVSNEGEVVYLWAPDPAGLYLYGEYPSANSLTTNYANGYMASQIMTLILTNKRMIERKDKPMEQMWLVESLALLGSAYRGGNDYSFASLAQYLASRPQHISLTENLDLSRFPPELQDMAGDEQEGLRAMFGWYLHSRLCDSTVNPCDKIKQIIDTDLIGEENLKAALGEPMESILKNFGLSVALGLVDRPDEARAFWAVTPAPAGIPKAPFTLPAMAEVRVSDPAQTFELMRDASGEYTVPGTRIDRTQASPYVTRKTILFQPLLPDNEMDIKPAKNSITYILVNGFMERSTDATAVLGKGLNVVVIPLGDRDSSLRQIVTEKVGENAHRDLRPFNLTSTVDAAAKRTRTYYSDPTYPELGDSLTVNAKRELWIMGSIDNYSVSELGAAKTVGDSDSYNVLVNPCENLTGAALTTCQGQHHQVIVQAIPRDFDKQLEPFMLLTSTRLSLFRGAGAFGKIKELDPDFIDDPNNPNNITLVCQSDESQPGGTSYVNCSNGGVRPTTYQTHLTTNFAKDDMLSGTSYLRSAALFDDMNWQINDSFAVTYDNFLFSAPNGFPYYNNGMMDPLTPTPRGDYRSFRPIETERQFFNFVYNNDTLPFGFSFYATSKTADFDPTLTKLDDVTIGILVSIKAAVDNNTVGPMGLTFIDNCISLGITESYCTFPSANRTNLQAQALNYIAKGKPKIICYIAGASTRSNCSGYSLTQVGIDGTGTPPAFWINPTRLITLGNALSGGNVPSTYSTYYVPAEPFSRGSECGGDNLTTPSSNIDTLRSSCVQKDPLITMGTDIRRQINTPVNSWAWGYCERFYHDWKVCGDYYSKQYDLRKPEDLDPASVAIYDQLSTDRARQRKIPITRRAGEIIGKPKRIHQATYWVKGNQPEIVHILIGGRAATQGKYIIRVRQKTFDTPKSTWPALPY